MRIWEWGVNMQGISVTNNKDELLYPVDNSREGINEKRYWIVGITLGNTDGTKTFVKRGYWEPNKSGDVVNQIGGMRAGDRIALKCQLGRGNKSISIKAIGIINDVDLNENKVYIEWLEEFDDRNVPLRGRIKQINGPYKLSKSKNNITEVFSI